MLHFSRLRFRAPNQPPTTTDDDDNDGDIDLVHTRSTRPRLRCIPTTDRVVTTVSLPCDHPTSHKRPSKHLIASHAVTEPKPSLIRRVTSKLNIARSPASPPLRSRPSTRTLPPLSPTLPNSFVSKEHREAALRERGLLPPRKDLSEQERDADRRLVSLPSPSSPTRDGSTEAERLKASWLAVSADPDPDPSSPRTTSGSRSSHSLSPDPDVLFCRSCDGLSDLPLPARPSICSTLPPLSTSFLEVLHEDPSEQGPLTPPAPLSPARVPIIVSTPVDDYPPSHAFVDSPISCAFSSLPGSTLDSHSHSDHLSVPDKENVRSPVSRRRTSDSARKHPVSLSKFGTRSLSNLHRSLTETLGRTSTSTSRSSSDLPTFPLQPPRTAIRPTIHSLGSIIRETRDIEDAESRRLSELAFLD